MVKRNWGGVGVVRSLSLPVEEATEERYWITVQRIWKFLAWVKP